MKYIYFSIVLLLLLGSVYLLGQKNGTHAANIQLVQNVATIKQIAELAALEVKGSTSITTTNATDADWWGGVKNFFAEKTLQVAIPYTAKFGIGIDSTQITVRLQDSIAHIQLPHCSLLSLQLHLDAIATMHQTGIFTSNSVQDVAEAEKLLYQKITQQLTADSALIQQAESHLQSIFTTIYAPTGYRVVCHFTKKST